MRYFRRSRFIRFVILPLTLVALLPACYKWSTVHGPPDWEIRLARPDQIRVTVDDGSQVEMRSPWMQGDSIFALTTNQDTLVIRVSDVTKLEKREKDWIPYYVAIVGAAVFFVAFCAGHEENSLVC